VGGFGPLVRLPLSHAAMQQHPGAADHDESRACIFCNSFYHRPNNIASREFLSLAEAPTSSTGEASLKASRRERAQDV